MNKDNNTENFVIHEKLQDCIDFVVFRSDEVKFLNKSNNKYFNKVFKSNSNNTSLNDVKSYLKDFFMNIQNSDFPLGHKYVSFDKSLSSKDEIVDFESICNSFHEKLTTYKSTTENQSYEI